MNDGNTNIASAVAEYGLEKAFPNSPGIWKEFSDLLGLAEKHREVTIKLMTVAQGHQMLVDAVFFGITNRSLNLCDGILELVSRRNFIAAAPLVRLQMDNLLRLSYMRTLKQSDSFAEKVFAGVQFNKMKDASGKKLTDQRLRVYAKPYYPWIDVSYEELSKLVHFSEKHIYSSITGLDAEGGGKIKIGVGQTEDFWPSEQVYNLLNVAVRITQGVIDHLLGWVHWKDENITVVEK